MPFDVIPEPELSLHLLGIFYRVAQLRDRRGDDKVDTHHMTGLPSSATDLLGRSDCPHGKELAMLLVVRPEEVPEGLGRRPDPKDKDKTIALAYIPRHERTDTEREWISDLTLQTKALVHKLTEAHGWFVLSVPGGNVHEPDELLEYGEDGMTRAFRITYVGLKAAFEQVPGTKYAEIRPLLADVGVTIASELPDWHQQE